MRSRDRRAGRYGRWATVSVLVALLAVGGVAQAQKQADPVGRDGGRDEIASRARKADRVVVATVVGVEPRVVENEYGDELIVSRTTVVVEEVFKGGGGPASTVVLEVEGGTIDGVRLDVSDMPALDAGDRGVFFVKKTSRGPSVLHPRGLGMLKLDDGDVIAGLDMTVESLRTELSGFGDGPSR